MVYGVFWCLEYGLESTMVKMLAWTNSLITRTSKRIALLLIFQTT
jgi:hypothetical protein